MKGQFYSIIAILIAIPIFIFTVNYLSYTEKTQDIVADRVVSDQISQLVGSIKMDTKKAMETTARRALLAATNEVMNYGKPLSDAVENITALMITGNINNTGAFLMINNTMPNWSDRISSKPVNFYVTLAYGNMSIESWDGFSIRVGMDINITVADMLGKAKIENVNERKYVTVSILGLEDPMFPMETQGFIRRIIREADPSYVNMNVVTGSTNSSGSCSGIVTFNKSENDNTKILVANNLSYVTFDNHLGIILEDEDNLTDETDIICHVTGNGSSVSLVTDAIASGYDTIYIDDGTKSAWSMPVAETLPERYYYRVPGPTFLQRLEGDYTPSPDGIATFIYVPDLQEQAFPINPYSRVAYRYFSDDGDCDQVENMDSWFGIDSTDAQDFNLTDLMTANPCVVT